MDNQGCMSIDQKDSLSDRTNHIDVKFNLVKDVV